MFLYDDFTFRAYRLGERGFRLWISVEAFWDAFNGAALFFASCYLVCCYGLQLRISFISYKTFDAICKVLFFLR